MSNIPPIQTVNNVPKVSFPQGSGRGQAPDVSGASDTVELSETAQTLGALRIDDELRAAKILEIREAIANGTYETEEKIAAAAERLLDVLRSEEQ